MPANLTHNAKELFRQIAEGDEAAFTHAFHHYSRFIYPYIVKKIQSADIAKEIIQETFLRLWIYRDALKETVSPEGYLFRIVSNLLQDHFRKQQREFKMLHAVKMQQELSDLHQTDRDVTYAETQRIVDKAVASLPPQQRHVYDLKQEGFSYEEIAGKLGISVNTVKNHLVKAGRSIKSFVKKKGLSLLLWIFS